MFPFPLSTEMPLLMNFPLKMVTGTDKTEFRRATLPTAADGVSNHTLLVTRGYESRICTQPGIFYEHQCIVSLKSIKMNVLKHC